MSEWSNASNSDAQARAFAAIRQESKPGVHVLSDASGKYFHAFCGRCGWRSTTHQDKTQPGIHARHHEDICDGVWK